MNNDTHDDSNPHSPRKLAVRDLHHDAQLLRDLALINARTAAELGPLPAGGLPVKPKRKPKLPPAAVPAASSMSAPLPAPARKPEDDPMKLHQVAAAAMVPLAVAVAGCSTSHGDPMNPKKNPHPVKRYEVTITADAPGPWDSIKGSVSYDVINSACTPKNDFLGVHILPQDIWQDINMTQVDDKTWKGYFYRDLFLDEDYYGLGVCHWDGTQFASNFVIRGVRFGSSELVEDATKGAQTTFFKKSDFIDIAPKPYGVADFSAERPEYIKNPEAFFPISVTAKEITP